MTRIIALVDGSIYARSVCDHAGWAAARLSAGVELLHVMGRREAVEGGDLSGAIQLGARSALMEELASLDAARAKLLAQRGRAILDDAQALVTQAGVGEVTTRLRNGDMVETLADVEAEADLIVLGKRGEAADFAKGHLGSNLERIVRASHKPVLVAARSFRPVQRVTMALDGGATSLKALDHITRSPLFLGLEITVVTVGSDTPAVQQGLSNARALLRGASLPVSTQILPGQPDSALAAWVDQGQCDLLVMGAYGHSRLRSLILGSTTTEMLRSCKVPVLLLR
jgi:nucleotide-binding universal stress UspA family protein